MPAEINHPVDMNAVAKRLSRQIAELIERNAMLEVALAMATDEMEELRRINEERLQPTAVMPTPK